MCAKDVHKRLLEAHVEVCLERSDVGKVKKDGNGGSQKFGEEREGGGAGAGAGGRVHDGGVISNGGAACPTPAPSTAELRPSVSAKSPGFAPSTTVFASVLAKYNARMIRKKDINSKNNNNNVASPSGISTSTPNQHTRGLLHRPPPRTPFEELANSGSINIPGDNTATPGGHSSLRPVDGWRKASGGPGGEGGGGGSCLGGGERFGGGDFSSSSSWKQGLYQHSRQSHQSNTGGLQHRRTIGPLTSWITVVEQPGAQKRGRERERERKEEEEEEEAVVTAVAKKGDGDGVSGYISCSESAKRARGCSTGSPLFRQVPVGEDCCKTDRGGTDGGGGDSGAGNINIGRADVYPRGERNDGGEVGKLKEGNQAECKEEEEEPFWREDVGGGRREGAVNGMRVMERREDLAGEKEQDAPEGKRAAVCEVEHVDEEEEKEMGDAEARAARTAEAIGDGGSIPFHLRVMSGNHLECGICLQPFSDADKVLRHVFWPCQHVRQCGDCAIRIWQTPKAKRRCPWCKSKIDIRPRPFKPFL